VVVAPVLVGNICSGNEMIAYAGELYSAEGGYSEQERWDSRQAACHTSYEDQVFWLLASDAKVVLIHAVLVIYLILNSKSNSSRLDSNRITDYSKVNIMTDLSI